mgnify:CR=1 FL=1
MSIPKSKSEIIFRAHSFGKIMSNERGSDKMGATAKTELNRMYAHLFYNRRKPVDNKFVRKGTLSEEKGITMYSKQYGKMVTKNPCFAGVFWVRIIAVANNPVRPRLPAMGRHPKP